MGNEIRNGFKYPSDSDETMFSFPEHCAYMVFTAFVCSARRSVAVMFARTVANYLSAQSIVNIFDFASYDQVKPIRLHKSFAGISNSSFLAMATIFGLAGSI